MEKQKRWQFFVIVAVIVLTIYNVLPTLFFYAKPLKQPIEKDRASQIAVQIAERVNSLQGESIDWIYAYAKNMGVSPQAVTPLESNPGYLAVTFKNPEEAKRFKSHLPRAGALIPFVPSQLQLNSAVVNDDPKAAGVRRQLGFSFDPQKTAEFFSYAQKADGGMITPGYRSLVYDRVIPLALQLGGQSDAARMLQAALSHPEENQSQLVLLHLAKGIVDVENLFGDASPIAKRYFATFSLNSNSPQEKQNLIQRFTDQLGALAKQSQEQQRVLSDEIARLKSAGSLIDSSKMSRLQALESQQTTYEAAALIIKRNLQTFRLGKMPLTQESIQAMLATDSALNASSQQRLSLDGRHPFIESLLIDWGKDEVTFQLYPEVQSERFAENATELQTLRAERLNQMINDEIALLSRVTNEKILPDLDNFSLALANLTNSTSYLALDLSKVAEVQSQQVLEWIKSKWTAKHADLMPSAFPLLTQSAYEKLSVSERRLALVVYAPSMQQSLPPKGMRNSSIYVIAKGIGRIVQQYEKFPDSPEAKQFLEDFGRLRDLMQSEGFFGYPAIAYGLPEEYAQDYIFEWDDFYNTLLKATRENFSVHGSSKWAVLEFTNLEQRLLTLNKIEDEMHESLLKWRDEYQSAQVDLNLQAKYDVPPPTKNVYLDNFKLSFKKYFRGDERKVLKWGLDLSGGKTVRIGLRDQANRPVTAPEDLRQGVNELYKRVNKMGISEVGIRIEGSTIVLDFPSSQGLSAQELVKASSMTFHIVNEKFAPRNRELASTVNQFLQEVWNEAVVTNRKDSDSINEIAWRHLGGNPKEASERLFTSDAAKTLYEQGLRLANPSDGQTGNAFDDTLSMISLFKGDDYAEWEGQTHPLLIVFNNYALAGSSLENVQVGYDPSKGNILSFGVRSSYTLSDGEHLNPRDDFFTWTSQFSQSKILGTPKEAYTPGSGWRMAVILNGQIVSSPTLSEPLREHAMISGHFSQREINQLAADLKAGSLTFTPKILSEQNVSPELGVEERYKGITAAAIAALLVVVVMLSYYRFAGLVASIAVLFNLLIMWGVLQNLDAAMTLPGIAGIILTVGMAVDANVLVYERIREEFEVSKRLPSAVQAGYRKAFSAIVDSNLTTVIAALILLQFNSGPIKGLAVTLIIGIISSMFTALFMTRYFFARWVQNPKHKSLSMARIFTKPNVNFLKWTKPAILVSALAILVGGVFLAGSRQNILGMDFTGGYALTLNLEEKEATPYRLAAYQALVDQGAASQDVQIRELNKPNSLRIQLSTGMELPGHPFYGLPAQDPQAETVYSYQDNPRIVWVVSALAAHGLDVKGSDLPHLDKSWTEMSGQLSDAMRNSALWGLGLALVCILIYLSFRFEFKYAISALLGLAHDILITIGLLGILHACGIPIQIDMQVIAALLTIIGYSLNDTIIVFDRVREDARLLRKLKFSEIVNHALNATLSRTLMTSGTTLLVLLTLVLLGGPSIFAFALVMTIGVLVGTFSSLFIAAPLLLFFHQKEANKQDTTTSLRKV